MTERYEVQVVGFQGVDVEADSREEAMKKAAAKVDFGDLATDSDEYCVERPDAEEDARYNVYKNGDLVEEDKPMSDHKANKLDGHTQFDKDAGDFERFRVEQVDA